MTGEMLGDTITACVFVIAAAAVAITIIIRRTR